MLKRIRKHDIYEVWNEERAESVLIQGKPNQQDLINICVQEEWGFKEINALKQYIKNHLQVIKEKIYLDDRYEPVEPNPLPKRPRGTVRCSYCSGCGFKMDDSYSSFGCPWCNGKGYVDKT
jgi:hypothetical protein